MATTRPGGKLAFGTQARFSGAIETISPKAASPETDQFNSAQQVLHPLPTFCYVRAKGRYYWPDMENGYRTAEDVVSGRLYHYEKFCPEWLEDTLRNKLIHCADPAKLNDPWDCRVWFDYRPHLRDPAEREKLLAFYKKAISPETLNHPLRPIFEERIRNSDEELIKAVEQFSRLLTEQLQQRRIYCLTPDPLSTLMWSHYGGDHTGICLEFHIGNLLFLKARGVRYREEYPAFVLTTMNSLNAIDVILTKAKCWEYEQEYRLIGSPKLADNAPLKLFGDFLKLPDRSLLSVIVGCSGDYMGVKKIVDAAAPEVRVIQVLHAPNQYNLLMRLDQHPESSCLSGSGLPRPENGSR